MPQRRHGAPPTGARAIVPVVLRVVASTSLLIGLYAVWPLDRDHRVPLGVRVALALAGLGLAFAWQVRSIVRSTRPAIRAVEGLAASIPLLLVTFAATYRSLSASDPLAFSEPLSKVGSMYFTVTTFATVGFGDIAPASEAARVAVSVQMLLDLLVLGLGIRIVVGAVRLGRDRQAERDGVGPARARGSG